ncbi:MAG: sulfotransferase family protein [Bacteroidota bacterium]
MSIFKSNNSIKSKAPLSVVSCYDRLSLWARFFTKRKKLTTQHDFPEPFFIIGRGRSGNTLLRSMLVAGNQVSIPPESYVLPRVIRIYKAYNFLPWEKLCALVISEFEAYKEFYTWEVNLYEAHQKARSLSGKNQTLSHILNIVYQVSSKENTKEILRWGDKTPINTLFVDKLIRVFPKAQFIHIIREPKDVVCSYAKAKIEKDYIRSAKNWKLFIDKANALQKKLPKEQFHLVHYEDLVSQPADELEKITAFLGLNYSDEMLDYWKKTSSLGDVNFLEHHKNVSKPVSTKSIGKWKKVLTDREAQEIDNITKSTFEKFKA